MRQASPSRQGPGPLPEQAVDRVVLPLQRRVLGRLAGDRPTPGSAADGMELSQLRAYVPGDDVRRLDPAASARTGEPHVRRLVPERTVTTWLVVDVSPSMAFGTTTRLKSDVAEGAAEAIARVGLRHGGAVSLTIAADGDEPLLPPQSGGQALADVRRQVRAGVLADGRSGDLARCLARVDRVARPGGLIAIVSDFRDDGWAAPLRRLGAQHSLLAVEVSDPLERELPDLGLLTLQDPETDDLVDVDSSDPAVRRLLDDAESERRAALAAALRSTGATHVELSTSGDWLRELGRVLR